MASERLITCRRMRKLCAVAAAGVKPFIRKYSVRIWSVADGSEILFNLLSPRRPGAAIAGAAWIWRSRDVRAD